MGATAHMAIWGWPCSHVGVGGWTQAELRTAPPRGRRMPLLEPRATAPYLTYTSWLCTLPYTPGPAPPDLYPLVLALGLTATLDLDFRPWPF